MPVLIDIKGVPQTTVGSSGGARSRAEVLTITSGIWRGVVLVVAW